MARLKGRNQMNTWKYRAIAATSGTQFGAIFAAAAGIDIPAPYFSGKAIVTSDNCVMADFVDRNGEGHMGAFVGTLLDLTRNTNGLSAHLKLHSGRARRAYYDHS
jgi:hypothetical protein